MFRLFTGPAPALDGIECYSAELKILNCISQVLKAKCR